MPGVTNPGGFNLLGQPNLIIKIDRAKAARYGFSVGDINSVVQAAIGGQEVTRVYEGEMNFALTVRFAPEYRRNVDAIRSIPVALPNNDPKAPTAYIALGELGEVRLETGAAYIYRENNQRFVPIKYSVRGRDLGSTVAEAQAVVAKKVPLPQGYRMEWTGEFGALVEAQKRLAIIVPLSLILIMMLLYSLFNSVRDSLLALAGIPFAVAGGILGLYVAGLNFSISAAIGFISLFGVSSMDGILLVSYIRKQHGRGTEAGRGDHPRGRNPHAADFHDRPVRLHRPRAGSDLDRHRRAGAAAARLRHRRRHVAVADLQPAGDPDACPHGDAAERAGGGAAGGAGGRGNRADGGALTTRTDAPARRGERQRRSRSVFRRSGNRFAAENASNANFSACSGKVGTGFPNRTCAKSKNLERITVRPNRDAL